MLATTQAKGPGVVQVRTQDVRPQSLSPHLVPLLKQYRTELETGGLVIVDKTRSRIRLLPLIKP
jgi:predicted nuclease of predicted toxin-antitoxin system